MLLLPPVQREVYGGVLSSGCAKPLRFSGYEFREPVNFEGAIIEDGAIFHRCIFCKPLNFRGARFRGTARFWKCVFRSEANFNCAVIEPRDSGEIGSIFDGEANFSWSRFEGPAEFWAGQFKGKAFFWRTIFQDKVTWSASSSPTSYSKVRNHSFAWKPSILRKMWISSPS